MSEFFPAGSTSQTIDLFIGNSSSTTGQGLASLVYNSSGLKCYYRKGATGSSTQITLATQTVGGAYSSGGFVEVDGTNMAGVYRFDIPNAVIDTAGFATLYFYGAINMVPTVVRIDCRNVPCDLKAILGTTLTETAGLIAAGFKKFFNVSTPTGTVNSLPDAVAGAANGLFIAGTNAPVVITGSGDALTLTSTGSNGHGLKATGNGSGDGVHSTGGATGMGILGQGGATSGHGIYGLASAGNSSGLFGEGQGSGVGVYGKGGTTGPGFQMQGGGTSGDGLKVITTSGHGVNLAPVGTDKHGLFITGGNGGTSDGIKAVAGTGGVPIRGNITGDITGNVSGTIGSLGTTAKSDVNAEVVDALNVDTYAEPGQGAPAATTTLVAKLNYLYKAWRNKVTQTSSTYSLFADDATTVDQKATVSDDGTTATRGEIASGP